MFPAMTLPNYTSEVVLITGILFSILLFLWMRNHARLVGLQRQLQQEIQERQQVERALREAHEGFLTVLDGLEAIVYVADMQTHKFLFTNKSVQKLVGTPESLTGKICWQTMQVGQSGPCTFCTNDKLVSPAGEITGVYTWEFQNTISKQWFYIQDRAIRWTDGRLVRLEIATEITAFKQAQAAALENESRFRTIFHNAAIGIGVIDKTGHYIECNSKMSEMLGYSLEELSRLTNTEITHPDDIDRSRDKVQQLVTGLIDSYHLEKRYVRKNGSVFWGDLYVTSRRDLNGNFVDLIGIIIDVSERKRAEAALRQSEERFDLAMRGSNDGIWDLDISTNQVYFSPRLRQIFGLVEEELVGKEIASVEVFNKVLHPDDVATVWGRINAYLEKTLPFYEITFRVLQPKGHPLWVLSRAIAVWNEQGKPTRLVGTIMDITSQKQAQEELCQVKENAEQAYLEASRFKAVLDKTADYVAMHDPDTFKFIYANQGALDQTGYSREELLQMTPLDLNPTVKAESMAEILAPLQSGIAIRFETVHQHKNGTIVPVDLQLQYVEIEQVKCLVAMARDITERKQFELNLQQAKETAEFANRAKSLFLANMSHELRTPLNGILGYTQILQRDKTLTPKQLDGINIIHRSGEYLLTLINDVLDLSKIEAGKIELLPVDFDFKEFISGLTDLFQMRARQKGIAFNYELLSHLPVGIRADEKRLRQILINLLGNAIKFTQKGGVTLKIGYHEGNIRFQVEDTGVGIVSTDLEKIFEPFQQVGDHKYKAEGTGLGLSITKKLVELMGGELQVESTPGKGSIFWMVLDLPEVSVVKGKMELELVIIGYQGPPQTILIIDDKWENRSVLVNLLTPLGFQVAEADHGQTGLTLLQQASPVNLIITDLVMPVMDGFEFARQVRKIPTFQQIPIIAASASVFDIHLQQSLTAGCNAFMVKPFRFEVLLDLLQKQLNLTWIYEAVTANGEPSPVPTDNPSANPTEMIGPTKEQAAVLFDLAMQGDIAGIVEEVNRLEREDQQLALFASKLRQLAKDFQEQQISELVEQYI